jgi:hypothetical protein
VIKPKPYSLYFKKLGGGILERRIFDTTPYRVSDTLTLQFSTGSITFDTKDEPDCCERNYADWDTALRMSEDQLQYIAHTHKCDYLAVKTPLKGEYFTIYIGYKDHFSGRRKQVKIVVNCYGANTQYYSKHLVLEISELTYDKVEKFCVGTYEDWGY